ncbi:MAG: hypothetical protein R2706_20740 [Acidimicrobiales bacterium]
MKGKVLSAGPASFGFLSVGAASFGFLGAPCEIGSLDATLELPALSVARTETKYV